MLVLPLLVLLVLVLVLLLLLGGHLPGVGFRRRLDCRRLCLGRRRGLGSRPGFFRRLMDRSRRGIGGSLSLGGFDRSSSSSGVGDGVGWEAAGREAAEHVVQQLCVQDRKPLLERRRR